MQFGGDHVLCVCVCMNKRFAVVSQWSYTDKLNIFNALLWLWGVFWVLTRTHTHTLVHSGTLFWGESLEDKSSLLRMKWLTGGGDHTPKH